MSFWRHISPRGAVKDLFEIWRQPQPYRWQVLGLAVAMTFALMMLFIPKSERIPPERPTITYISTFDQARSEAEIVRSNEANQKRKEEAAAIQAQRVELRKEMARALGRATGLDVDKMEKQIARDQAAEAAAKAKEQQQFEARRAAAAAAASGE